MEANHSLNLMDVDDLIHSFFNERERGIDALHSLYIKNNNQISVRALKEELMEELRTGCVCYLNKKAPLDEINNYLFYITNSFCKKLGNTTSPKQKVEYICPGCLYLGKEYFVINYNKVFQCDECQDELKQTLDSKKIHFFTTFAIHNKKGYRCIDCQRFIPHPLDNSSNISCPYFDCCFVGTITSLVKMHHPNSKSNPEKLILDISRQNSGPSLRDALVSQQTSVSNQLEITQELWQKVKFLQEIIETQSNNIAYSSSDATVKHKQCVYQAILKLLNSHPVEMVEYLSNTSREYLGFQHKIFQEYISLLEDLLPFVVSKNKVLYKIQSLLDENLCLFDGISVFDGIVDQNLVIKNKTKEFYIGGRKASYTKPFYIGKLLNLIQSSNKVPLMHLVKDYSFNKICMRDIAPETPVTVTHLRAPPHYQMGGMVYVNRARKKIVDRFKNKV